MIRQTAISLEMAAGRDGIRRLEVVYYGSVRFALDLAAARRLGLELPGFTRLDVMSAAAKLPEDSGLLNLLLERFERPLDAIGVAELNLYHASSDDRKEKRGPARKSAGPWSSGTCPRVRVRRSSNYSACAADWQSLAPNRTGAGGKRIPRTEIRRLPPNRPRSVGLLQLEHEPDVQRGAARTNVGVASHLRAEEVARTSTPDEIDAAVVAAIPRER